MGESEAPEKKTKAPKKAKRKKKAGLSGQGKSQGINVHVNVVNTHGDGHKKSSNQADDALARLRGYP